MSFSPTNHWKVLVNTTMVQARCNFDEAWKMTTKTHPDANILMMAYGATPQKVQFCNARILARLANPNPKASREAFQEDVQAEMKRTGLPYGRVFNLVQKKRASFANSEDLKAVQNAAAGSGGVPTLTPALAKIFRLPNDVSADEWRKIWEANGGSASTINYGKCFSAVCDMIQAEKTVSIDDAVQAAKARFSDLWAAVSELAKLSF